jgi:hypothetical protein
MRSLNLALLSDDGDDEQEDGTSTDASIKEDSASTDANTKDDNSNATETDVGSSNTDDEETPHSPYVDPDVKPEDRPLPPVGQMQTDKVVQKTNEDQKQRQLEAAKQDEAQRTLAKEGDNPSPDKIAQEVVKQYSATLQEVSSSIGKDRAKIGQDSSVQDLQHLLRDYREKLQRSGLSDNFEQFFQQCAQMAIKGDKQPSVTYGFDDTQVSKTMDHCAKLATRLETAYCPSLYLNGKSLNEPQSIAKAYVLLADVWKEHLHSVNTHMPSEAVLDILDKGGDARQIKRAFDKIAGVIDSLSMRKDGNRWVLPVIGGLYCVSVADVGDSDDDCFWGLADYDTYVEKRSSSGKAPAYASYSINALTDLAQTVIDEKLESSVAQAFDHLNEYCSAAVTRFAQCSNIPRQQWDSGAGANVALFLKTFTAYNNVHYVFMKTYAGLLQAVEQQICRYLSIYLRARIETLDSL